MYPFHEKGISLIKEFLIFVGIPYLRTPYFCITFFVDVHYSWMYSPIPDPTILIYVAELHVYRYYYSCCLSESVLSRSCV